MSDRLNRIITGGGDQGLTGLADGSRRLKDDPRIDCLGEVDELNATLGICICHLDQPELSRLLLQIQHDLFDLGAELSQPGKALMSGRHVDAIQQQAQTLNTRLPPLTEFILPGGSLAISHLHQARTVCRRVERGLVRLNTQEPVNPQSLVYLNRLSDLLFIASREVARQSEQREVYWQSELSRVKAED